ncbi:hypothetical protein Cni_G10064 [Canna indica]|uniref:Uncharacterized protein n=1 Tax=Canna indica TaxID=4628 RepID=A0AAQ3QA02_9LILI|nr:hypothetical protein Cni_G10064 [Canna indica]
MCGLQWRPPPRAPPIMAFSGSPRRVQQSPGSSTMSLTPLTNNPPGSSAAPGLPLANNRRRTQSVDSCSQARSLSSTWNYNR